MYLLRLILTVVAILNATQTYLIAGQGSSHHASREEIEDERPQPISILRRPIRDEKLPAVCISEDFTRSCGTDQRCKTRKEHCGDAVSFDFNDEMINVAHGMSAIHISDGKYSGNKGFDDLREFEKDGQSYGYIGENKADKARLNRKTNQGSYGWTKRVEDNLLSKRKVSLERHQVRRENTEQGRTIRSLSHVSYSSKEGEFQQDVGFIFSADPVFRQTEVQSYCQAFHPQIKAEAQKYSSSQTSKQKANFASLDRECTLLSTSSTASFLPSYSSSTRGVSSPTSQAVSYADSEDPYYGVCSVNQEDYSHQNLRDFLSYLSDEYSYASMERMISRSSRVSARVLSQLVRDEHYGATKEYRSLWEDLTYFYAQEYEKWLEG